MKNKLIEIDDYLDNIIIQLLKIYNCTLDINFDTDFKWESMVKLENRIEDIIDEIMQLLPDDIKDCIDRERCISKLKDSELH